MQKTSNISRTDSTKPNTNISGTDSTKPNIVVTYATDKKLTSLEDTGLINAWHTYSTSSGDSWKDNYRWSIVAPKESDEVAFVTQFGEYVLTIIGTMDKESQQHAVKRSITDGFEMKFGTTQTMNICTYRVAQVRYNKPLEFKNPGEIKITFETHKSFMKRPLEYISIDGIRLDYLINEHKHGYADHFVIEGSITPKVYSYTIQNPKLYYAFLFGASVLSITGGDLDKKVYLPKNNSKEPTHFKIPNINSDRLNQVTKLFNHLKGQGMNFDFKATILPEALVGDLEIQFPDHVNPASFIKLLKNNSQTNLNDKLELQTEIGDNLFLGEYAKINDTLNYVEEEILFFTKDKGDAKDKNKASKKNTKSKKEDTKSKNEESAQIQDNVAKKAKVSKKNIKSKVKEIESYQDSSDDSQLGPDVIYDKSGQSKSKYGKSKAKHFINIEKKKGNGPIEEEKLYESKTQLINPVIKSAKQKDVKVVKTEPKQVAESIVSQTKQSQQEWKAQMIAKKLGGQSTVQAALDKVKLEPEHQVKLEPGYQAFDNQESFDYHRGFNNDTAGDNH